MPGPTSDATITGSILTGNRKANGSPGLDLTTSTTNANDFKFDHTLVMTAGFPLPADVIRADPKLGAVEFNGSFTKTHALVRGSPGSTKEAMPISLSLISVANRSRARTVSRRTHLCIRASDRLCYDGFDL